QGRGPVRADLFREGLVLAAEDQREPVLPGGARDPATHLREPLGGGDPQGRRRLTARQAGFTSTIFFLPAASLMTPPLRSARVTSRAASAIGSSLSLRPPPWARRRASDRDEARPASVAKIARASPDCRTSRLTSKL